MNVHQGDENQSGEDALCVKHNNKISYIRQAAKKSSTITLKFLLHRYLFRFPNVEADCEVEQVS